MNATMKYRKYFGMAAFLAATATAGPALAEEAGLGNTVIQLAYSVDTFYFLMSGALVMWMAAGFAMLEAGLVRSKKHCRDFNQKCCSLLYCLHHVHVCGLQHHVCWWAKWFYSWLKFFSWRRS